MIKRLFVFAFAFLFSTSVFATEVKFTWDPNTESDLAGYALYENFNNQGYNPVKTILAPGTTTTRIVTEDGNYKWVLKAFDNATPSPNYSLPSNEVGWIKDSIAPNKPQNIIITITISTN